MREQEGLISSSCLAESICACSVQTERGASEPAAGREHTKRRRSRSISAKPDGVVIAVCCVKELTCKNRC